MQRLLLVLLLSVFVLPVGRVEAGRNLNNLSLTVRNIDNTGAISSKYFDGKRVVLNNSSDGEYIEKHLGELQSTLARCAKMWGSLTAEEQNSAQGKQLSATLQKWVAYHDDLRKALDAAAKASTENDAQCRSFAKEVMDDQEVAASIYNLMHPQVPLLATRFGTVRADAEKVAAACAQPRFANVGVNSCAYMKVNGPQRDPSQWCAAALRWKDIMTANVDAQVDARVESFNRRPLVSDNLKGDQNIGFFSKAVPNREGWRSHYRIEDMVFTVEAQKKYIDEANMMYESLGLDKRVSLATFDSITRAMEELRNTAEANAGSFDMPKSEGSDYTVNLAKKQLKTLGYKVKFIKGFVASKSFKIRKNNIGVPLDRSKSGWLLMKPAGQDLCTLISYTATEVYKGGGKYTKPKGVHFNMGRFQKCR